VAEVALLLLSMCFTMALCAAVVIADKRRLPLEQRDRAWNFASFASAIFAFAPWCIVAHFWVTRRSLKGFALGLLALLLVLAAMVLFNLAAAWALGVGLQ
jgi:hypothetical protein